MSFKTHEDASRVAASLRGPDLQLQKVSRRDAAAADELPEIVYDDIDDLSSDNVAKGTLVGGAIGAGSGLFFLGIPGLNIAAPIAGMLAGAWIGAVSGIDETMRGIDLPTQQEYQQMLAEGKSFLVITGSESERIRFGNKMNELGAEMVHQHPPVLSAVREPSS